jgi:HAD superfamily hydrolase (TIGR01484 family)
MQPFHSCPPETLKPVSAILSDLDGTLTDASGRVPVRVLAMMERLAEAGVQTIVATGRPAGWADMMARHWPVAGVIAEIGAMTLFRDPATGHVRTIFAQDEATRRANAPRLAALREALLREIPQARISVDQPFRLVDLAIDHAEDGPPLPREVITRIVAHAHAAGAVADISSIHVNIRFGDTDKGAAARAALRTLAGLDLGRPADAARVLAIGDSPNDVALFALPVVTVGVAGLRPRADDMTTRPRWLTAEDGADGFIEMAQALLKARA